MRNILEKIGVKTANELLGVDIGTTSIKVCVLKKTRDGFRLHRYAKRSYDQDLLHDGAVVDGAFVAGQLKHLLNEQGIKVKAAAAALSSYTVITKRVTM
ncbi:MAG: pilus assembly protein PilM, partial [candidate division WOR-3 bacterium]